MNDRLERRSSITETVSFAFDLKQQNHIDFVKSFCPPAAKELNTCDIKSNDVKSRRSRHEN